MQKTYTADFLSHKQVINRGEMQQVFVEGSHEAIIPKELFNRVQLELARRAKGAKPAVKSAKYPFGGRLVCPDCGNSFTRRIWDADDPRYKRAVWQCVKKYDRSDERRKGPQCASGHISEKKLIAITYTVMERVFQNREEVINTLQQSFDTVLTIEQSPREGLIAEILALQAKMEAPLTCNDMQPESQEAYSAEYSRMAAELDVLMKEKAAFDTKLFDINARRENALALIEELNKPFDFIKEAPEEEKPTGKRQRVDLSAIPFPDCHFPYEDMNVRLFALMIEKILFHDERHMEFVLKDGSSITYQA